MPSAQYNSKMKVHNLACRNDSHRSFHRKRKIPFEQIFVNIFTFFGIISTALYDMHSYYFYNRRFDSLFYTQAPDFVVFGHHVPLIGFNVNLLFNEEVLLPLVMLQMLWNIQPCVNNWIWINSLKHRGYCVLSPSETLVWIFPTQFIYLFFYYNLQNRYKFFFLNIINQLENHCVFVM
jgi:hypothetical protein